MTNKCTCGAKKRFKGAEMWWDHGLDCPRREWLQAQQQSGFTPKQQKLKA